MEIGNQSLVRQGQRNKKSILIEAASALGKLPPQAIEMEEAVLGAMMLERDALTTVIDILQPEHFYKDSHQFIFLAIRTLFQQTEPVDIKTVVHQLRKSGHLEQAGGAFYIAELTSKVNSAANIEFHARIIVEQYIKRELIQISSSIQTDAYEDTTDVFKLLDRAEQEIYNVSEKNLRKSFDKMDFLMNKAIKELEEKKNLKDGLTGVPSGFTRLDQMTSGWQPSDLIIIAARPGMGKTAFVVSAMRNAAVDFNMAVAIFSLEMSSVQLVNRLISAEAELPSERLKKGDLAEHEWQQLMVKTKNLPSAPIFIDDTPGLTIMELRAKARRLASEKQLKLIIIDYLQLMSGDGSKNIGGNREQEIASISRALKNIAKELNVPVIALSQLSRAVETRGGDKKPMLSDLRESGSIEQDADMVMFLYRPEYYGITQGEDGSSLQGVGEVIIAKNRHGKTDSIKLKFVGQFTKFDNLDEFEDANSLGGSFGDAANMQYTRTFPSKGNAGLNLGEEAPF